MRLQVRAEARPSRTDEACAMDVVKAHRAKAVARSEPGVENVTRTQRQPANRAKTEAEAYSKAPATKAEERDVSGRPDGPPTETPTAGHQRQAAAIHEPTAIVVGRPAPRLGGNPGLSPVRLITPITGAVGHPTGIHLGRPAPTVVRHLTPLAVGIEIARPCVLRVGVLPGLRSLASAGRGRCTTCRNHLRPGPGRFCTPGLSAP